MKNLNLTEPKEGTNHSDLLSSPSFGRGCISFTLSVSIESEKPGGEMDVDPQVSKGDGPFQDPVPGRFVDSCGKPQGSINQKPVEGQDSLPEMVFSQNAHLNQISLLLNTHGTPTLVRQAVPYVLDQKAQVCPVNGLSGRRLENGAVRVEVELEERGPLERPDHHLAVSFRINQDKARVRRFKIDADPVRLLKGVEERFGMVTAVCRPTFEMYVGPVVLNFGIGRFHFLDQASEIRLGRDDGIPGQVGPAKKKGMIRGSARMAQANVIFPLEPYQAFGCRNRPNP
jgi:hypothetical protein